MTIEKGEYCELEKACLGGQRSGNDPDILMSLNDDDLCVWADTLTSLGGAD